MYGASYTGFSQWAAVKKLHPALRTIVPQAAVGPGIDFPTHNNVFSSYMLQWIHYVTNNKTLDLEDFADARHWDSVYKAWYLGGRSFNSLDSIDGRPSIAFHRWLDHNAYDDYWKKMAPQGSGFANINIPVLTISGYYDVDQLGALHYLKQHYLNNKNAEHYLVIGPYDHVGIQSFATPGSLLGYQTDPVAIVKIFDLIFSWFDYILKGKARPALLKDRINYQVMATNSWQHVSSLKETSDDTLTFYLSGKQILSTAPGKNKYTALTVDFTDRNDTAGMGKEINIADSFFNKHKNTRCFVSAPFNKDIQISGSLTGRLNCLLNKRDADFVTQLFELTADGKYFLLNNNILRASYAKDDHKRNLLSPGKMEAIQIGHTYFVSKLVKRGSRLVFVTGINKNYNWEINYGTGKEVQEETIADGKEPLAMRIYETSYIKIPVKTLLQK